MKDSHPQSSNFRFYKDIILHGDQTTLPGHDSLEIVGGSPRYITPTPSAPRHAAVVLLIHESNGVPSIIFIQRSDHVIQDKHRGQIAFPGGKLENNETLKECAFREMEEEIGFGLPIDHPSRSLTPLYVSVSNFLIHPYVVFKDHLPPLRPNPEEVATIIDSPLTDLEERYTIYHKDMTIRDRILKEVPYYEVAGKTLWGATALIFSEFLYLLYSKQ